MRKRTSEELDAQLIDITIPPAQEIPPMIRQRQDETYAMLDSIMQRQPLKRHRKLKQIMIGSGAALIVGVIVLGSGFTSPVMAKSLERIPLVNSIFEMAGDIGLRTAKQKGLITAINSSAQAQDVTITATELIYDGTRLSVALKREGGHFSGSFQGLRLNPDGTAKMDEKGKPISNAPGDTGEFQDLEVLIDGQPLNPEEDEEDSFKHSIGLVFSPGSDEQSLIVQFSEKSYNGDGITLPEQFQMTLKTRLTGMDDDFEIIIPVKKDTSHNKVLFPEVSKNFNKVTTTVEKITMTPATTQIRVNDQGVGGLPSEYVDDMDNLQLYHEFYDDKGNLLHFVNGGNGWMESEKDGSKISYSKVSDINIEPLPEDVEYITLRTYLYKYTGTGSDRDNLRDAEGYPIVEYIPQLEILIPIR